MYLSLKPTVARADAKARQTISRLGFGFDTFVKPHLRLAALAAGSLVVVAQQVRGFSQFNPLDLLLLLSLMATLGAYLSLLYARVNVRLPRVKWAYSVSGRAALHAPMQTCGSKLEQRHVPQQSRSVRYSILI
jgi:hypothetical protein